MLLRLPASKAYRFSFFVALFWFLGLSLELFLNLKGQSFCETYTCRVVAEFSLLDHQEMVLLGLFYFGGLLFLLGSNLPGKGRMLLIWSTAGLSAETVFLLRQALEYRLFCPFCLGVALGVFLATGALLKDLGRDAGVPSSLLGALIGLTAGFLLTVNPLLSLRAEAQPAFPDRPPVEDLYLVYSPRCPHCHEVLEFCRSIPRANLNLCPKEKARGLFRLLGIQGVPVLVVIHPPRWEILEGSKSIISYLERRFEVSQPASPLDLLLPQTGGVCSELKPQCE